MGVILPAIPEADGATNEEIIAKADVGRYVVDIPDGDITPILFPGFRVTRLSSDHKEHLGEWVKLSDNEIFWLERNPGEPPICPKCGKVCSSNGWRRNPKDARYLRDYSVCGQCIIGFAPRRCRCECGHNGPEHIDWIPLRGRMTYRFMAAVQQALRADVTTSEVAKRFGIDWNTVRKIDKSQLVLIFEYPEVDDLEYLAIDEVALFKGHKYATVFFNLQTSQVIAVVEGKSKACMEPVFQSLLNAGQAEKVKAVSCDMNGAYPAMIKKYMPQAEIVYDRFHIVKNYREKVLIPAKNRVFTELSKGMKSDEKEKLRRQIKLMDWVLVMDEKSEKLKKPRERIEKFVKDNELLLELAPMMTKLREVWETWVCEDAAEKLHKVITEFEAIGRKHKFNPTKNFAGMLRRRSEGIITWGKHKISTGKLEGANNRIKTLKKITYGVEFEYFALKVKSMFPGKENVLKQIGRHSLLWQNQAIHTAPGKFVKNRITPRQVDVEALKRAKEAEALPPPALAVPEEAAPAVATP